MIKTEIGFESYLTKIKNPAKRIEMTKFRLSNHNLMIESGRHKNIPRESRICPFGCNSVENEIHFLLLCPTYTAPRSEMIEYVISLRPHFTFYSNVEKFQFLLQNLADFGIFEYIYKFFELRNFLNSRPKMLT